MMSCIESPFESGVRTMHATCIGVNLLHRAQECFQGCLHPLNVTAHRTSNRGVLPSTRSAMTLPVRPLNTTHLPRWGRPDGGLAFLAAASRLAAAARSALNSAAGLQRCKRTTLYLKKLHSCDVEHHNFNFLDEA